MGLRTVLRLARRVHGRRPVEDGWTSTVWWDEDGTHRREFRTWRHT